MADSPGAAAGPRNDLGLGDLYSAPLGLVKRPSEFIELGFRLVFLEPVALLQFADELIALAGDRRKVVVGQLAPLLLYFASELLPVAFDLVPIHDSSP